MERGNKTRRKKRFHHFIFGLLCLLIKPFICRILAYHPQKARIKTTPCLIYANHNCDIDPILISLALRKHMYFVASEHIAYKGWGPLVISLFDPILRFKGRTDARATLEILRRLRGGDNVCIFIEGERSYDGRTGPIFASAAHLAKLAGVPLLTFRFYGGYFTHPRWARRLRRGRMSGQIVGEYSVPRLKAMGQQALQTMIERDLYVDAYEDQELNPCPYRGKQLAENLETALFICPLCHMIGLIHSRDDVFACECGMKLRYTEYGYIKGVDGTRAPFATVRDWYVWQREKIKDLCNEAQKNKAFEQPLIWDERQSFYTYEDSGQKRLAFTGSLALYADKLKINIFPEGEETIALTDILSFSCHQQMIIGLNVKDGRFYEIVSPYPRSAVKYQIFFDCLNYLACQPS